MGKEMSSERARLVIAELPSEEVGCEAENGLVFDRGGAPLRCGAAEKG